MKQAVDDINDEGEDPNKLSETYVAGYCRALSIDSGKMETICGVPVAELTDRIRCALEEVMVEEEVAA